MSRPTKFNALKVAECIELVKKGYNVKTIAKMMGISEQTLMNWQHKYPKFKELVKEARSDSAKECIEVGLRQLATGSKDSTVVHKHVGTKIAKVYDEEADEMVEKHVAVEITETIKTKAPDSKALEILARKYDKEFIGEAEDKAVTINLLEGFTMRDLQESRQSIEAESRSVYAEDED